MPDIDITALKNTSHDKWMKPDYEPGLVTVIIPTYNRADFIVEAIESVFKQYYRPIQLIVVDDGSTDDTRTIIRNWIESKVSDNEFVINYIYQENKGAPAARNLGLIHSNGEFIQFLDSDCLLLPKKISTQVRMLRKSDVDFCYCMTNWVDADGNKQKRAA